MSTREAHFDRLCSSIRAAMCSLTALLRTLSRCLLLFCALLCSWPRMLLLCPRMSIFIIHTLHLRR